MRSQEGNDAERKAAAPWPTTHPVRMAWAPFHLLQFAAAMFIDRLNGLTAAVRTAGSAIGQGRAAPGSFSRGLHRAASLSARDGDVSPPMTGILGAAVPDVGHQDRQSGSRTIFKGGYACTPWR